MFKLTHIIMSSVNFHCRNYLGCPEIWYQKLYCYSPVENQSNLHELSNNKNCMRDQWIKIFVVKAVVMCKNSRKFRFISWNAMLLIYQRYFRYFTKTENAHIFRESTCLVNREWFEVNKFSLCVHFGNSPKHDFHAN